MVRQVSAKTALVLAIVSIFVTPVVLWVQTIALLLADMIVYEPSNPGWVKALAVIVVVVLGVAGLALPLWAFVSNKRVASRVIAGVMMGLWGLAQLFYLGLVFGVCSFEGCSF